MNSFNSTVNKATSVTTLLRKSSQLTNKTKLSAIFYYFLNLVYLGVKTIQTGFSLCCRLLFSYSVFFVVFCFLLRQL